MNAMIDKLQFKALGVVLVTIHMLGASGLARAADESDRDAQGTAQNRKDLAEAVNPAAQNVQLAGNSERVTAMRAGNYLGERGHFDPHPFDNLHLGDGLIAKRSYFDWKNARWEEHGTAIGGYFSPNIQWGGATGGSHRIGEFLLTGAWETYRRGDQVGRIIFGFAHDQTIGAVLTRTFADNQGIVETPNDLDTSPDKTFTTLGLLAWEQEFWKSDDAGWGYRAGQLFAPAFFGLTEYLDDDRRFFIARPLASAAGAQWVGSNDVGLGAQLIAWKRGYYATLSIIDGDSDRQFPDISSLADGRLLYLTEFGIEKDMSGPSELAIRVTLSHLDETARDGTIKPPGESVIVGFDRKFDGRWALAGRWSKSYRRLTADYRELYSLGAVLLGPFGFEDDSVGFGLFSGDPSDSARSKESGAEIFYKIRLSQDFSIMPDVQYWHRNDLNSARVRSWIYGLRLNFEF